MVTTATGAFLVVLVFGMSDGIRAQSASLGHADEIGRAVVLIAVTVLLVGVVEVAVATTRTVAHRTRELGVLGANGVPLLPDRSFSSADLRERRIATLGPDVLIEGYVHGTR